MPCLILSLDGGGLRGIIPVLILKHIEEKVKAATKSRRQLINYFDLVAGTSTGALIACGITLGTGEDSETTAFNLEYIEDLYREKGKVIFPYKGWIGEAWRNCPLSYLFNPQFSKRGLEKVLSEVFGERRLLDCVRPLLITTYNVATNEPFYFSTRRLLGDKDKTMGEDPLKADLNYRLTEICRATSAGPTYLVPITLGAEPKMICVDGGVFQNNPTTPAVVDVLKYASYYKPDKPELTLDDIFVLSIGTGRYNEPIAQRKAFTSGKLGWLRPILDISLWGNSQAVDMHMKRLFRMKSGKKHYLRLNVDIKEKEFADMAVSRKEAMWHYTNQFFADYVNNPLVQAEVDDWLRDSGIVT